MNLLKKRRKEKNLSKKIGIYTILYCLCLAIIPNTSHADPLPSNTSNTIQLEPTTTWSINYYNNPSFQGYPVKTETFDLSSAPIKFSSPLIDLDQTNKIQSIRSTTSTEIQNGKYTLSAEFLGKLNLYLDNKLILQDESLTSTKKVTKSVIINDLLSQPTSREIHSIRIEQISNTNNPSVNLLISPDQQTVDLTLRDIAYNWGYSSPIGYPTDFFTLPFSNTDYYPSGDYFASLSTEADAEIIFDEKKILELKSAQTNKLNNAVIENVTEGLHTVKTNYTDSIGGEASLFSTIVPFSNWVAYYYNNTSFTGQPVTRQIVANPNPNVLLRATNETNSPIPNDIASNNYGVKYIMYKRFPAGLYQLDYKAGDGINIWLDGKQIVYEWKEGKKPLKNIVLKISDNSLNATSKDIHQLTIRTYNRKNPQNMLVSLTPITSSPSIKTIVLDPGHGGKDTGAIGIGGLKEKDVVLDVGKRVESLFNELTPYKVYLTRSTDVFIPLGERPAFAIRKKANAFVSIHANSGSSSASGLETYYYGIKSNKISMNSAQASAINNPFFQKESTALTPSSSKTNPYITDSKLLANFIQKRMVAAYNLKDRGAGHGNFQVIRANRMPAVLTEIGFITNKNDSSKLNSPYFRQIAAEAIYMGILDYFEYKGSNVANYRLY